MADFFSVCLVFDLTEADICWLTLALKLKACIMNNMCVGNLVINYVTVSLLWKAFKNQKAQPLKSR